jgi:hypothetical protein
MFSFMIWLGGSKIFTVSVWNWLIIYTKFLKPSSINTGYQFDETLIGNAMASIAYVCDIKTTEISPMEECCQGLL